MTSKPSFSIVQLPVTEQYDAATFPILEDIVISLQDAFARFGIKVPFFKGFIPEDGSTPIYLNYCVSQAPDAPDYLQHPPAGSIIYNLEAHNGKWAKAHDIITKVARDNDCKLWDINEHRFHDWNWSGPVRHMPFGFSPRLLNVTHATEKDIDVLFYGSMTDRRSEILMPLFESCPGFVYFPFGINKEREHLMGRARIILSLRAGTSRLVERVRVIHAMANGCLVLCEDGDGIDDLREGMVLVEADELVKIASSIYKCSQHQIDAVVDLGKKLAMDTQDTLLDAVAGFLKEEYGYSVD